MVYWGVYSALNLQGEKPGKEEFSNNNPVYETAKETLMYRTVLWTL